MGSITRSENLFVALKSWFQRQSVKKQICQGLAVTALILALLFLAFGDFWAVLVLYLMANILRVCGISVLIYKLTKKKTCAGLSLKSQELTAICLAVRIYLNAGLGNNNSEVMSMYTIASVGMDLSAFIATIWVVYIIRFKLRSTYMEDVDNLPIYYVLIPCAFLALATHPLTEFRLAYPSFNRVVVAFVPYLEAVLVLPQLRVMQSRRIVEAFTAFYVFALGAERILKFAFWVTLTLEEFMDGSITADFDFGFFMFLLSEIVQSFILADFVYYYVKTLSRGQMLMLMRLPTIVVEQSPV